MKHVTLIARSGPTHRIRLGLADYALTDLQGFKDYAILFQILFAQGGGPWVPKTWMHGWLYRLDFLLEMERDVLPYRYGADGDFGGVQTVSIQGEQWSLTVGSGECSLTQSVSFEKMLGPDVRTGGSRLIKWIDLRGRSSLEGDGQVIKLSRKKHDYRWYGELPGLLQFLKSLSGDDEVRALSTESATPTRELIRIADEEPGGFDAAVEILSSQNEKALQRLRKALHDPKLTDQRPIIQLLLETIEQRHN
jgi:hypothetical protein